ncbi:MAG: alpha,alpha-trehalase TreF [Lewinellaceae bacterium]|nr:alpha,alpha-trehalase TreF [Lewinellaceae bacterium]
MKYFFRTLIMMLILTTTACRQAPDRTVEYLETKQNLPPQERYGELFIAVQMNQVFPDGKTFVDCTPKYPTDEILDKYQSAKGLESFDLKAFVLDNFELPRQYASGYQSDTSRSAAEHINELWPVLTRQPDDTAAVRGTLIPLPNPYIVPGGRFGEIYYWDSYFTMLGLQAAGKVDMIENMIDNFAYLIDTIGFIPNGNRDYFLTRSQPPFFAAMVQLLATEKGSEVYQKYLPQLEKEYRFWMNGIEQASAENPAVGHVVRLKDGSILNRYWDEGDYPRAEMYRDDVETVEKSGRDEKTAYRHIRSACESGWDFSSRWLADKENLHTIHTNDIIPVDLNCLLYNLEQTLAAAYAQAGDQENTSIFQQRALQRQISILRYCWDSTGSFFKDYDFVADSIIDVPSLAGMFPLFFNIAVPEQARKAAAVLERDFLKAGGLLTTLNHTGQQWDAPNGWAPLQWASIVALRNYGFQELANEAKKRWVNLNIKVYRNTGKMVEKYNVEDMSLLAGGGEYPVQDGFGWTNGVLLRLLMEE